jgi:hypothetical protein
MLTDPNCQPICQRPYTAQGQVIHSLFTELSTAYAQSDIHSLLTELYTVKEKPYARLEYRVFHCCSSCLVLDHTQQLPQQLGHDYQGLNGLTGGTRTPYPQLRRLLLYPDELRSDILCLNPGAPGRNRTGMPLRARDFKSLVSTYFTTGAWCAERDSNP